MEKLTLEERLKEHREKTIQRADTVERLSVEYEKQQSYAIRLQLMEAKSKLRRSRTYLRQLEQELANSQN